MGPPSPQMSRTKPMAFIISTASQRGQRAMMDHCCRELLRYIQTHICQDLHGHRDKDLCGDVMWCTSIWLAHKQGVLSSLWAGLESLLSVLNISHCSQRQGGYREGESPCSLLLPQNSTCAQTLSWNKTSRSQTNSKPPQHCWHAAEMGYPSASDSRD